MKPYVVTFMEDMAIANDRNPDPAEFIKEMKLRGKVVDVDEYVEELRAEYQHTIDKLVDQANASTVARTDDEIAILTTYRACKEATGDAYQARINALEKHIEDNAKDFQAKLAKAVEVLNG